MKTKKLTSKIYLSNFPTNEKLDEEFRAIISHSFLGEDENISKESFDLAIEGCINYINKIIGR